MANENFLQLPSVAFSTVGDIIAAVQGGVTVQETLQQVLNLSLSQTILNNNGDPNNILAGNTYQLCWDISNKILYICTTTGNASTAIWTNIISSALIPGTNVSLTTTAAGTTINAVGASGIVYNNITTSSATMIADQGYVSNNAGLVTLTLPTTAAFGSIIPVSGLGAGGWKISQNSLQQIHVGSLASTVGTGGSIASTNQFNSLVLLCTVTNTTFSVLGGAQGNITVI